MTDATHEELRQSISRFLDRHSPVEAARAVADGQPFDLGTWQRLCDEFDLLALAIPEDLGGLGAGFEALGVCANELGRVLYPGPWVASGVLAASLLTAVAPAHVREARLPALLSGSSIGTLALHDTTNAELEPNLGESTVTAHQVDGAWTLRGTKCLVPDLGFADVALVSAIVTSTGSPALFLVVIDSDTARPTEYPGADLSRRFGALELLDAPAVILGTGEIVEQQVHRHLDLARLLLAAESVGAATATLRTALEYAGIREQFGRPIGSFQAVKHKLADLWRDVESARHVTRAALAEADADTDLRLMTSIAVTRSSDAFSATAKEVVHLHGGIGYTWEHDAHLFYRRALHNRATLGHPGRHRERIVTLIGV